MPTTNYRDRIYRTYASQFQQAKPVFDAPAADRWGKAYDTYFRGWLPESKDAAIVDLACGNGMLLHFFKGRGYTNIAGVDISGEQVALSKQVVDNVEEGNVLQYLASRRNTFDLITAIDIIEHLGKDEALDFLDGIVAALKPGGRLILQTPNAESPWMGQIRYGDFTHEVVFTVSSLGKLMMLCGLQGIQGRETGPVFHGLMSTLRGITWQVIRVGLKIYNIAETGTGGSGVFTRVFLVSGTKPL
jgi:2-polyprenyl-3-methyl-5-hydroxy-6-metoxy-1,4-benzoquinol methylase